jgi:excisionase family DNA binding protein
LLDDHSNKHNSTFSALKNCPPRLTQTFVWAIKRVAFRLLTIDQVAQRLSVSRDWVYRNGKSLGFTRKLGPKMVRFSESGLQKWLKAQER